MAKTELLYPKNVEVLDAIGQVCLKLAIVDFFFLFKLAVCMHSMQTNGASKNQYWPGQMGTIFLCDFGITWCWFLGVSWGSLRYTRDRNVLSRLPVYGVKSLCSGGRE